MNLNYADLRCRAKPIGDLIDGMSGQWDRHAPLVTAVREADVIVGIDPQHDVGAVLFGAGREDDPEARHIVFTVSATKPVPGTGGSELTFLNAALVVLKELPLDIEGVTVRGS